MYKNIVLVLVLAFGGCSLKPPMPEVHGEFTYSIEASNVSQEWWKNFNDKRLNVLVEKALKYNSNLTLASLHVEKAKKMMELKDRDFFPSISAKTGVLRAKQGGIANNFSLSGILNYEVDLWGRVKNSTNASKSLYKATKYDLDAVRLSVASQVVGTYFLLIEKNLEKKIIIDTLKAYKKRRNYQKKQFDAGAISELTYLQSVAEYENVKVKLSSVENNIDLTKGALALLVGKDFDDVLYSNTKTEKMLPSAPTIPSGISSDILLNRPDVASAYEKIKSANFLRGVAKSAYFPTLSLTSTFGYQSSELDRLFTSNTNIWSLGGQLAGKVFDFGRTSLHVDMAKLDENIRVANYNIAVKSALSETRNALNSYKNAIQTDKYLSQFLKSQKRIYKLALDMFDEGYTTQLQLLDAQRILLSAKLQKVQSKLNVINSVVSIYKAFGGGFKANKENQK